MTFPDLQPNANPGGALHRFLLDEQRNVKHSIFCITDELKFLDALDDIYKTWLFPRGTTDLREEEILYFALYYVSRNQTFRASASLLRYEIGEAFLSSRVAAEAAFYALMLSNGRLTADQYLNEPMILNRIAATQWKEHKSGSTLPDGTLPLLRVMNLHSSMGAHADPMALAGRFHKDQTGALNTSYFQWIPDEKLRDWFLGIVWVGGICLTTYFRIAKSFGTSFSEAEEAYKRWQVPMIERMGARELLSELPRTA
jgi:hypothetical protein